MRREAVTAESSWQGTRRVLVVHNRYQQPGGEESVVEAEVELLRSMGADVTVMIYSSQDEAKLRRLKWRPDELVFNRGSYAEALELIRRHQIQLVHCHNLMPLISLSVYSAAAVSGALVVQAVHNYRMGCLNGLHLRDGVTCKQCRPGYYLPGMVFGCYRSSRPQSAALGMAQTINHLRGAWEHPAVYVTPGRSLRDQLVAWGIPSRKVVVKPHFVSRDPGPRISSGTHALFVGRLSPEKGLDILLDVWDGRRPPLVIAGDGPLRNHLERRIRDERRSNVRLVGRQDRAGVDALLRDAIFLVAPSVVPETFGLVVIEAYSHGVPVVASRLGGLADLVQDGVTGLLARPTDREDLATKLTELTNDSLRTQGMGRSARSAYQVHYSAEANATQLRAIYDDVLQITATGGGSPTMS